MHFIAPDGKTRIGPWLLHDSHDDVRTLIDRCKGWPWNGYELRTMKQAEKYPPKRLPVHDRVLAEDRR